MGKLVLQKKNEIKGNYSLISLSPQHLPTKMCLLFNNNVLLLDLFRGKAVHFVKQTCHLAQKYIYIHISIFCRGAANIH